MPGTQDAASGDSIATIGMLAGADVSCFYCFASEDTTIARLGAAILMLPERPHIAPEDGGHLVVTVNRHVASRRSLVPHEMLAMDAISIVGSKILATVFKSSWTNYQENGNWSAGGPANTHIHLHVYGRHRTSRAQPFGEALRFPRRAELSSWSVRSIAPQEMDALRQYAASILASRDAVIFHTAVQNLFPH